MKRIFLLCIPLLFIVTNASAEAYIEHWIDENGFERSRIVQVDNPNNVVVIPDSTPEERDELRDLEIEVHPDGTFTIIDSNNDRRWNCDYHKGDTRFSCNRDPFH